MFRGDFWTERARARLADGIQPVVSDFAVAEFASSIARDVRMRTLPPRTAQGIHVVFDRWRERKTVPVQLAPADVALATTWLRRLDLNLRAPDALHLAIASRLDLPLLTFDAGMTTAARVLSVSVTDT